MQYDPAIGELLRRFPHLAAQQLGDPSIKLSLGGVLPMVHKGTTYHLPVEIQFPQGYPARGPVCWLRPGAGMVVDPTHPDVGPNGRVTIRDLHEWTARSVSYFIYLFIYYLFIIASPAFLRAFLYIFLFFIFFNLQF
jgi:hypothetical protein